MNQVAHDALVESEGCDRRYVQHNNIQQQQPLIFLISPSFLFHNSPCPPLRLSPYGPPPISDPSSLSFLIAQPISPFSLYIPYCTPIQRTHRSINEIT